MAIFFSQGGPVINPSPAQEFHCVDMTIIEQCDIDMCVTLQSEVEMTLINQSEITFIWAGCCDDV